MSGQLWAWFAAAGSAGERHCLFKSTIRGAVVAAALAATGCTPATARMAGADPADPAARTAGVGYRSTIAPYTRLRPSTPESWRQRNDNVTPKPKREQP